MAHKFKPIYCLAYALCCLLVLTACGGKNDSNIPEEIDSPTDVSEIDYDDLLSFKGRYYYEDDKYKGVFGIDVSTFQDDIDWKKVSEDDVKFAYIRIGRRGAADGHIFIDDLFETNYRGAYENGIKVGVYFFSQAYDEKEAIEEAEWVLRHIKDKHIDLPIAYDCETVWLSGGAVPRIEGLSGEQLTDNALAFCARLGDAGYPSIIYTNMHWAEDFYQMGRFEGIPFWFAQYDVSKPDLKYPIAIWQYSDKGKVKGIEHEVDLDIMFIEKER